MSRSVKQDYEKAKNPGIPRVSAPEPFDWDAWHEKHEKECPVCNPPKSQLYGCATCDGGGCGDCA